MYLQKEITVMHPEPEKPHDARLVRIIQRIYIERLRGKRFASESEEEDELSTLYSVRLKSSQELFKELIPRRTAAWLTFLREWTFRVGCGFRVLITADGEIEWWITRDELNEKELTIPWYREAHYIEDLFAVLDSCN